MMVGLFIGGKGCGSVPFSLLVGPMKNNTASLKTWEHGGRDAELLQLLPAGKEGRVFYKAEDHTLKCTF